MCCRYWMEESPELKPFVDAAMHSPLKDKMVATLARPFVFSGEIKPTDICVAVAPDKNGRRAAYPMVWGFTGKSSHIFNARVETADEKPSFKESLERRRCIIPASWYFEWQHLSTPDGTKKKGDKYLFQTNGKSVTLLAGIYRIEEERGQRFPHFTILTCNAGEKIKNIHDRMPVVLSPADAALWIRPDLPTEEVKRITDRAITDLLFEKAS